MRSQRLPCGCATGNFRKPARKLTVWRLPGRGFASRARSSSNLSKNNPHQDTSPDSPETCILLAVFEVIFSFNQLQRLLPYCFILYFIIIQIPKTLDDIIADQGAILFRDALFESTGETGYQFLLLLLSHRANFPYRLHAMPGGDKPFVLRN